MKFYNTAMYCKTTGMWPSRPQQPDDGVGTHHLVDPDNPSREIQMKQKTAKERTKQGGKSTVREQREESKVGIKRFNVSTLAAR